MLLFLARRLTRPLSKKKGHSQGFLRYARTLSIAGIAVGTAGLMIALAVAHGFKQQIAQKILDFGAPITITSYSTEPLYRADTLSSWLTQRDFIAAAWPVVEGQVVLQSKSAVEGALIKGIAPQDQSFSLQNYLVEGVWLDQKEGVVLGKRLSDVLGLKIGELCTVYSLKAQSSAFSSPKVLQLPLIGIYETGVDRFDDLSCFIPVSQAQSLLNLPPEQAHQVHIQLAEGADILRADQNVQALLAFPYFTENIYERFSDLFSWIRLQEQIIPPVIGVLMIVAAFNLIGAVLMVVLQKSRHIGVLISLGLSRASIRRLFILQALWLSGLGWAIGMGIFALFHWTQTHYPWIPLDPDNYYLQYAPSAPQWWDMVLVAGITLVLSIAAGWLPARVAAKTDVIQVLRFSQR